MFIDDFGVGERGLRIRRILGLGLILIGGNGGGGWDWIDGLRPRGLEALLGGVRREYADRERMVIVKRDNDLLFIFFVSDNDVVRKFWKRADLSRKFSFLFSF